MLRKYWRWLSVHQGTHHRSPLYSGSCDQRGWIVQRENAQKNDGEKENNNSSPQKGIKKVAKHEQFNVYTNPQTNPQRNPNVDSKRREPLSGVEIKAVKEAHQQYPELGSWNLSLLLSNEFTVHVSTMSILRVLDPERYTSSKIAEKEKCYENPDHTSCITRRPWRSRSGTGC